MEYDDAAQFRYHRSPPQAPYEYRESAAWGSIVRYVELGDDGYALRQIDEFQNGYLSRYDRTHWDDQFGTLADLRFGEPWIKTWGTPIVISQREFEEKWASAGMSIASRLKTPSPPTPPPWIRSHAV
jgi:hypothetical protein